MHLTERIRRGLLRRVLPQPVDARHAEYSMIFSADDETSRPSPRLMALALDAIRHAQRVSLTEVSARMDGPPRYPDIWPGESYKLLAGLVAALSPHLVIEIGTGGGTSALSMKRFLPPDATLVTFDLIEWRAYPGHLFREDDFSDGRLIQHTDDLTQPAVFAKHRALFQAAGLFFIDAAKDGVMEEILLDHLRTVPFPTKPIIVFDDIRLWNMLRIWREIPSPKLDLTSFGHWTGTGLVEWDLGERARSGSGRRQ